MPDNLHEYLKTRRAPVDVNLKHHSLFKAHDKIASITTRIIGSMYAVYAILLIISLWITWQLITERPIDPYPFAFLLFLTNIAQLLLTPLILVGQNIQNRHAHLRAEEEYQTTKTIHTDIETILTELSRLRKTPIDL
ncbi:MAG: Membrane protein-like protein [Candidatus Amesbacteria bacterium GW2011_GWB1_47_26]|uniref:Membrane protein-like protein n=1 Tax=Candidatus Amesbacteria bacterium GW2011_GWC2_45_19 TaxID=1618366 RepID=A0A0G1M4B4_9BACT|nr:MAG: Membrane protein-like protein [Candidatus Amesbacteria bacterium GW2011_GWC2_45_19]KKU38380.1 MAG: Membrane protein-like protein [Candidatus Amesbacteria bacterium GW2011_GWA1_46_35]KKU68778.1 MAG: Membrane protein-like protein [Microgenomates group bacterium GW2011_GWC1_47_20]KKU74922.1 MAG: Membrane protein-like protein [Candidatus Amesbacteria bacterium GW2011_GWB1_47_26]KKU80095.1 MAG: Membrane protein-like protein [Candidatus Amesbacteria bacterium GW2011_GWA2_47_70]